MSDTQMLQNNLSAEEKYQRLLDLYKQLEERMLKLEQLGKTLEEGVQEVEDKNKIKNVLTKIQNI